MPGAPGAPGEIVVRAGGGDRSYRVLVRRGALADLPDLVVAHAPAHRYAVIADANVAELYGGTVLAGMRAARRPADLLTFPAGEANKNRRSWARLTDALLDRGHARDSAVIALGGGVTGDLAGFVAATFMRGVPVVQVPTSLVAMVDASIGGKTGVDTEAGKNLVGAFHPPRLVLADPEVTSTLPRAERAQGLAEAVKHGAILDVDYLDEIARTAAALLDGDSEATETVVLRSVQIKGEVVTRDEREGGLREVLNFGHTLGHALEAAAEYRVGHGSAVAVGMVLEARLGEALGVTRAGTADRLADIVARVGLPASAAELALPVRDVPEIVRYTRADKKGRGGRGRYVLLEALGRVARSGDAWSREVDESAVEAVLREEGPSTGA